MTNYPSIYLESMKEKKEISFTDYITPKQRLKKAEPTISTWDYVAVLIALTIIFVIWYQFKKLGF